MLRKLLCVGLSVAHALTLSDCAMKHVKLGEYQITEVTTPSFPSPHSGSISCTLKFEAPAGLRPAIEFQHWDLANCITDRIHVVDRKMSHHYKNFCGGTLPQPVTGTGRFLELVINMAETGGWFGGGGNTMKLRVSAFRGHKWKPTLGSSSSQKELPIVGNIKPSRKTSSIWDMKFTGQDITTIVVGGAFVFLTILGGLVFSFHLKREDRRKARASGSSRRESMKQSTGNSGQPKMIKKTGFRPYMAKINIESDLVQTSSTDLGDSSDRSENTENSEKNSGDELYNSHKLNRTKEREARRQKRLDMLQTDIENVFAYNQHDGADHHQQTRPRDTQSRDYMPEADWNRNTGRLPGRYKDADYEKWSRTHGIQRKETMREKVNTNLRYGKRVKRSQSNRSFIPIQAYEHVDNY